MSVKARDSPIRGKKAECFLIMAGAFSAMVTISSSPSCFQESISESVCITCTGTQSAHDNCCTDIHVHVTCTCNSIRDWQAIIIMQTFNMSSRMFSSWDLRNFGQWSASSMKDLSSVSSSWASMLRLSTWCGRVCVCVCVCVCVWWC